MQINNKNILVTGAAGFIGFHLIEKLISLNVKVVGIDNLNDYYDVSLKLSRLEELGLDTEKILKTGSVSNFNKTLIFHKIDLTDLTSLKKLFENEKFDIVVNLAAQAGVRYSIKNPHAYIDSNITGFLNLLECCKEYPVEHLLYASSSSVYGINSNIPFSINDNVDQPISLYASTKKANELMAFTYSHLFKIPSTGLRFFTVYGPWGRPDMAYFSFAKNIMEEKEIVVYNHGNMVRDFTFISDIVDGILKSIQKVPVENCFSLTNPSLSNAPFAIFNLGNNKPIQLLDFIEVLEKSLGKRANLKFKKIQDGDVLRTWADIDITNKVLGYFPKVEIEEGLKVFADWFRFYYNYELKK